MPRSNPRQALRAFLIERFPNVDDLQTFVGDYFEPLRSKIAWSHDLDTVTGDFIRALEADQGLTSLWTALGEERPAFSDEIRELQKSWVAAESKKSVARPSGPAGLIDFTRERARHGNVLGRDNVFSTIETSIEERRSGWVLVRGGPGTGKSAILAAMLDRFEAKCGKGAIPHHFVRRGQADWSEPEAILRNLNAQLESLAKPDRHSDTQGIERLTNLLGAAAESAAANHTHLVLVIDALDEIARPASDDESGRSRSAEDRVLPRLLPEYLPDGVWILCASRPNYPELGWIEQRPGLRTIDLDQPPWIEDNQQLVAVYWRDKGPRLSPPLARDVQDAAIKAAEGNILHAVTLCDAFEADPTLRDPKRIPVGFRGLLDDMWLRIVEMEDRATSKLVIDGLGLLSIAGESLPLSVVSELLDWGHPADIATFKRRALPFLLEEHADWFGGEARYRPFHEATREFLTSGDRMMPKIRRSHHKRLAEHLCVWPPEDEEDAFPRAYAAKYALAHLAAIADWSRIGQLLRDLQYGVAALEALGPRLFLDRIMEGSRNEQLQRSDLVVTLTRVLRQESQSLGSWPEELPNIVHNQLVCQGWSLDRIRGTFSGFERGWGLLNAIDMGDQVCRFRGHTRPVSTCDLDEQGRYGVSGSGDGTVRVWDLEKGTGFHVFRPDPMAVQCDIISCAMSNDGQFVAASSRVVGLEQPLNYSKIQVWRRSDGQLLLNLEFDYEASGDISLVFAGPAQLIAGHATGRVDIHDLRSKPVRSFDVGKRVIGRIAVNNAGELLAVVHDDACAVWRLNDTVKQCEIALEDAILCYFSPDGRSVAVAAENRVLIANSADGTILRESIEMGTISDGRLLPNGRWLFTSGMSGAELVVWDFETNRAISRYQGHTYSANCCAITPDGMFAVTGGSDNTVRSWSLREKPSVRVVERHGTLVYACVLNDAGTLCVSAPQDASPALSDARTGRRLAVLPINVSDGNIAFVRPNNTEPQLAALTHGSLQVWDPLKQQLTCEFPIPDDQSLNEPHFVQEDVFVQSEHFPLVQTDRHAYFLIDGQTLQATDIPEGATIRRLDGARSIACLDPHHDLEIIDIASGTRKRLASGVVKCVGSPKKRAVYVLTFDRGLCCLNADSGEVEEIFGAITDETATLVVDAQERTLWVLASNGRRGFQPQAPTKETIIAFSLDGSGKSTAMDAFGHIFEVFAERFFPDGKLITAGWDGTLRIWDATQTKPIAVISGPAPFRCVDVVADRIVAGDQKGNVWFLAPMAELYPKR